MSDAKANPGSDATASLPGPGVRCRNQAMVSSVREWMSCTRSDLLGKACQAGSGLRFTWVPLALRITSGLLAAGVAGWISALIMGSKTIRYRDAHQLENHQISRLPRMGSTRSRDRMSA